MKNVTSPAPALPVAETHLSARRLGTALFLLSFATVLFTLSVWKLLAFFIMPSLFFDLLFIGFPIGAFLGVRFFRAELRSLQRTLWILQLVMIVSVGLCLVCKHFDYLRAHLFEVHLLKLIGQMGTFTAFFIPFFCAYGLSEYVGYQVGRRHLRGRMRPVYALYLFGAAFAYVFAEIVLHRHLWIDAVRVGVSHLLVLSVTCVAVATALLARGRSQRLLVGGEVLLLSLALLSPDLEERFLGLYKGDSPHSTKAYAARGHRLMFQRWGHYSLTEILGNPEGREFTGFYNDLMQWTYASPTGFEERMLGIVPLNHLRKTHPDGRIAVIGSGGGRQVRWAQQPGFGFESILALELEPAVFEAVRGPLEARFDRVYEDPGKVRPVLAEARGYMERTDESFDLIFLPSVGGYPQMMLEPGNMIRTIDAYRTLRGRLSPDGMLAIWYPAGLDPDGILTRQYVRTLGAQGLGMKTRAFRTTGKDPAEFLIMATDSSETAFPEPEDIDAFLNEPDAPDSFGLPPQRTAFTARFFVTDDPEFKPITDEQPFLAGNVRHIFTMQQVYLLLSIASGFFLVAGGVLLAGLRRRGDPGIPGRSYWQVSGLAFLLGANFILIEHYVVLALFKKVYVYHEALVLGAISFLVLSGLGSMVITSRSRRPCLVVASVILLALLPSQQFLPPWLVVACLAPVAVVTGSLFPALFERAAANPLAVFAMDALGAAVGSMLSFFIPIALGFSFYFPAAAAVFLLTAVMTWRFFRTVPSPPRASLTYNA